MIKMKKNKGFTLIEILVTVGVLGIIAAFGTQMFLSILRNSKKTQVLTEIKQNGDYAINVMERMIRNAEKIIEPDDTCSSCNGHCSSCTDIKIKNPDRSSTVFRCSSSPNNITLSTNGGPPDDLINSKADVDFCNFNVTKGGVGVNPDTVVISFTLSEPGVVTRPEDRALIEFKTSVTLRNY